MKDLNWRHGVSAIALSFSVGAFAPISLAQEETAAEGEDRAVLDTIVVSGIRASLEDAAAIKRNASGVVDAISATDIGKFPDTNLAESLQRITGVSIDRVGGEGSRVTVRGFGPDFNIITMNGRQIAGSAIGLGAVRSFDFSNLASEGVAGINVYKTGRAEGPSGGIGSSIDIKTPRPLNFEEGITSSVTVKGLIDDSNEVGDDITPELSGIVSANLLEGRLGLLLNGSFQARDSRDLNAQVDGWRAARDDGTGTAFGAAGNADFGGPTLGDRANVTCANTNPTGLFWMPRNSRFDTYDHERERTNLQAVAQFRPMDTLTATVDWTYSKFEDDVDGNTFGVWFNADGNVNSAEVDQNGTVVFLDEAGGTYDFFGFKNQIEREANTYGLNLAWDATDALSFELDYSTSEAEAGSVGTGNSSFIINSIQLASGGKVYDNRQGLEFANITVTPDAAFPIAPATIDPLLGIANGAFQRNSVDQLRLSGVWHNTGDGALQEIRFGYQRTDFEHEIQSQNNFFGYGFASGNSAAQDDALFTEINPNSLFSPLDGGTLPNVAYTFNPLDAINEAQAFFGLGDFVPGDDDTDNRVEEKTDAFYLSAYFDDEFNGIPYKIDAGLRFESTEVAGTSLQTIPTGIRWQDPTEFFTIFAPGADLLTIDGDGYDVFLPNVNFQLEPIENLVTRLSYSRTITRPNLAQLPPALAVTPTPKRGARTASSGNPSLLPYEADNFDATAEWYYGDFGSYVSVGYYKKWVGNFPVTTLDQRPLFGLTDPASGPRFNEALTNLGGSAPIQDVFAEMVRLGYFDTAQNGIIGQSNDDVISWDVSTTENGENVVVDGIEFAVQHSFWDTGFGVQANYTTVDGDVNFDVETRDLQFTLPGLSDSYNIIGYYDKYGFQARIAYNYRDSFLNAVGQAEGGPLEPQFTEEYGQWDFSASYDINDMFTVFFEGVNITDETQRIHGRYQNQLLNARAFGARYALGVRASF